MLPRLVALLAIPAAAFAAPAPDWASQVVGTYVGRDHNRGELQCESTEFFIQDGALVGHYHIADDPPFDGELTDFKPAADGSGGWFTWRDPAGTGVHFFRFSRDFNSFYSAWGGAKVDPRESGYGLKGADTVVPGCNGVPTS